ncbi:hypothetical protein QVD17_11506 [Tagetes erecta]|uniref:Alpha/beta hydrolase fold-3 domain-containing protein n=1 Tax=Tagetes erecta TaxID=13708 RepID=A0AAD8NV05_TARER|nr:hypothetical protein QVD17_11506 [Tagetes erecta]
MAYVPHVVEDLAGVIQIFSDGSIHRHQLIDSITYPIKENISTEWKDYCYNKLHNLHLRIYKPKSSTTKLPVIYYLHGGGFCVGSFSRPKYHNCCLRISEALNVIVVAPNLRLAPEHRLPAAMDDAFVALKWLQKPLAGSLSSDDQTDNNHQTCTLQDLNSQSIANGVHNLPISYHVGAYGNNHQTCTMQDLNSQNVKNKVHHLSSSYPITTSGDDVWFESCDIDQFFVIGDSSGGNLAHHLAVRLGPGSLELTPIKIRGYVMLAPFFGGTERTKSEAEGPPEKSLNVDVLDTFWRMALPVGVTADHPFANPFGPQSPNLDLLKLDPILIFVGGHEVMKDRVKLYAQRLKELQKAAHYIEIEGKQHGLITSDPYSDVSDSVLNLIKNFMFKHFG